MILDLLFQLTLSFNFQSHHLVNSYLVWHLSKFIFINVIATPAIPHHMHVHLSSILEAENFVSIKFYSVIFSTIKIQILFLSSRNISISNPTKCYVIGKFDNHSFVRMRKLIVHRTTFTCWSLSDWILSTNNDNFLYFFTAVINAIKMFKSLIITHRVIFWASFGFN